MQNYEQLGVFYLGRRYDVEHETAQPDYLLYDAKDLTTHAVCVGMTGSGKTGLCLSLLEEAAIDGVPAIAIDPKGDLGNLLLTFPELRPEDFRPWVEEADAARQGITPDQLAVETAKQWRDGLAQWDQDGTRIANLRAAVDMAIYTPGSNSGLPLTVLRSFDAPPSAVLNDSEALRERVSSAASGLLALLGIDADPIRSREHILLSNILQRAWTSGRDLDLPDLIREIQQPPFDRVGVMDLESIFPTADRFAMSMQFNNLLASPSFANWMEGESLNVKRLLYTPEGRPRLSIISIAHLSDSERMFFVTILLNEVLAWVRSQPGTSSLRALLYMDEVFGYFPPTANPPSKTPMLTLLKQARAYGLGIVLATQNPVDLDYKGLSNAGTWFLGRLQTERDKARVLDGLEGASAATGATFDRKQMETLLSRMGNRVFLMNNVHDDEPIVFQTRWAMSYLRGPLTRDQIQTLMSSRASSAEAVESKSPSTSYSPSLPPAASTLVSKDAASIAHSQNEDRTSSSLKDKAQTQRPLVPPDAHESFIPSRGSRSGRFVYRPHLIGVAKLHFVRATYGHVDTWKSYVLLSPLAESTTVDNWQDADLLDQMPELDSKPEPEFEFADLPTVATRVRSYSSWRARLKDYLYREKTLTIWKCGELKQYSRPEEQEDDFRIRLSQSAREKRDAEVEKLRKKYQTKLSSIKDRIQRSEHRVDRETSQYRQSQFQTAISFGTSILGALFGRKLASATNVRRAGSSMKSAGRTARERGDIGRAEESLESLQQKLTDLEQEAQEEIDKIKDSIRVDQMELESLEIRPRKSDIAIDRVSLVWAPYRVDSSGIAEPAF